MAASLRPASYAEEGPGHLERKQNVLVKWLIALEGFATKLDGPNSVPRPHSVLRENRPLQTILYHLGVCGGLFARTLAHK